MHIIVGVDGSENSRRAAEWAVDEARRNGATIEAVVATHRAFDDVAVVHATRDRDRARDAEEILDEMVKPLAERAGVAFSTRVLITNRPAAALVDAAVDAEADLLVLGTRGRGGFAGLLLGSVAESCLHRAQCSTVLVPFRHPDPSADEVIVGVDGSTESIAALQWAVSRAKSGVDKVSAVYAWNWLDKPEGSQYDTGYTVDDASSHVKGMVGNSGLAHVVAAEAINDLPSRALIERAENAALLVVASHGQGRARATLAGSVARQVAHHTTVPLVVHR